MHKLTRRLFMGASALIPVTTCWIMPAAQAAAPKYWQDGKTIPAIPHAAWEADGKVKVVSGEAAVAKAPSNAVKYTVKTCKWPTGSVRVFEFTKAGGGVLHVLTDESHFFVVKGSVKVMLGSTPVVLKRHDVGADIKGPIRSGDSVEDTEIVAWIGGPVSTDKPKPTIVRVDEAFYGARGVDTKPPPPPETVARRYVFPGNSVRYAHMYPNKFSAPHTGALDNLNYLLVGHVQYTQGGETYQVHAGDFFRQEAGTVHAWDQKEGAEFLASSVLPVGVTQPMEPSKMN